MPLLPPRRIAHAQELLDADTADPAELRESLQHVEQVNRFLGGESSLLRHLRPHLRNGARFLDVGTGNAAVPRRIAAEAQRLGVTVEIVGIDTNPAMIAIARASTPDTPAISFSAGGCTRTAVRRPRFRCCLHDLDAAPPRR